MDLFDREQKIFDNAYLHVQEIKNGKPCNGTEFESLLHEYGRLLKQLRNITKLSDMTTTDLSTSKRDLLGKVHYDALTGIYNRRFVDENLKRIINTLSRVGQHLLSVLMIDVDFFKNYNDTYGHSQGDECLRSIAAAISSCIKRSDDFAARYGGEEFIVVLPNTNENGACEMANKILEKVRACHIIHEKSEAANFVTVAVGVTTGMVNHSQSGDDYIKQADRALYTSKQSGRNKYTFIELS